MRLDTSVCVQPSTLEWSMMGCVASLKSYEMIRQAAIKCLSLETITKRTKFNESRACMKWQQQKQLQR